MEIDPHFQKSRARSRQRRNKRRAMLAGIWGGGLGAVALVGWIGWSVMQGGDPFNPGGDQMAAGDAGAGADDEIVQVDTSSEAAAVRLQTPFVDIPGDPMILRFDTGADSAAKTLAGPPTLDAARVGPVTEGRLVLVSDDLIVQERKLITALPSSREDFAFFQAQRSQSLAMSPTQQAQQSAPDSSGGDQSDESVVVVDDGDSSFGAALGSSKGEVATYTETKIENTTSVTYARPEAQRDTLYSDLIVHLETPRPIKEVLTSNGFNPDAADALIAGVGGLLPFDVDLPTGTILAMRNHPTPTGPEPLQISLYGPEGFIGSVASRGLNSFVAGSDPWLDVDLRKLAAPAPDAAPTGPTQNFRLLDAVYSAAIRNGVPTTLVGEMIVMLSKSYDLDAFAAPGDRVTMLYAPNPSDDGPGPAQILYAAIKGPSGDMKCYVVSEGASDDGQSFACFNPRSGSSGGSGGLGGGFIAPVNAPISSTFGPRFHPILKEARLHAGVDWAAPTGTEIHAAGAGRITRADRSESYGNVVYIDHPNGFQTRYAHLDRFAPGIHAGMEVTQGQLIGFVGTTGRSTGPHLHFEVHDSKGDPIDPLNMPAGPGGGGGSGETVVASNAVEALTEQIIHVESGGNANARNPLSSATGLGQFIESTWLRMMRDYRPDLSSTMSRADLLALRTDPTLSREMVMNLARENESFLRGRGNDITVGRLYLAHFLGPGGAATVLASQDNQRIIDVMGGGVVSANPFLANFTVADLKAWADRKMGGTGGRVASAPPPPAVTPPEVRAYQEVIDEIVTQSG